MGEGLGPVNAPKSFRTCGSVFSLTYGTTPGKETPGTLVYHGHRSNLDLNLVSVE